jgi:NAD(P)-dependent dehydrogenase (short-subunit alcohol dehydrogenase family)
MQEFKGKVAVITGAASGIGHSLAEWCAQEGMKLVLADIEEKALAQTALELKTAGATVLAVQTDVSKATDVEALAQKTLEAFGAVHLLFNNAGVAGTAARIWENTLADWEWVLNVNLWGTVHGIRTFVPIMLQQDTECHIINTASIAGLISGAGLGVYKVSKHSIVSLSETLSCELTEIGAKIKVSVLCPVWVNTQIMHSERNRPSELQNASIRSPMSREVRKQVLTMSRAVRQGISPQQVAEQVFDAIRNEKFYIFTHPESKASVQKRMENILLERSPA